VSRRPSPYARSISGLLAGLAATGTLGYFTARGISGPPPTQSAQAPQRAGTGAAAGALQAAAAGDNGADFGFTGYCGVERHAVKDLLDGFVPAAPQDSSVALLRGLPVPTGVDAGRTPPEKVVYRIVAIAVAFKIEADSDVHLAIADPADPNATMIAEFPAASCLVQSIQVPQMEAARSDMVSALGDPPTGSSYTNLNPAPCVTLTGLAFFDRLHHQRGVAPNGIELHPVLAFQAGCGVPAPPATTPTTVPTTTPEPPDTTPVTTVPLPTVTTPTVATITSVPTNPAPATTTPAAAPTPRNGFGCKRYPGRHWYKHQYHRSCQSYYFTTP